MCVCVWRKEAVGCACFVFSSTLWLLLPLGRCWCCSCCAAAASGSALVSLLNVTMPDALWGWHLGQPSRTGVCVCVVHTFICTRILCNMYEVCAIILHLPRRLATTTLTPNTRTGTFESRLPLSASLCMCVCVCAFISYVFLAASLFINCIWFFSYTRKGKEKKTWSGRRFATEFDLF